MCLRKDLHAHSKHTVLFCFSHSNLVNSELGQGTVVTKNKHLQKAMGRQWAFSNLISDELWRASKWVSAAEVVLRGKAVRQGRQRGFLKGNRRGAERKRYWKQLSFKNKYLMIWVTMWNKILSDLVINTIVLLNSLELKVYL